MRNRDRNVQELYTKVTEKLLARIDEGEWSNAELVGVFQTLHVYAFDPNDVHECVADSVPETVETKSVDVETKAQPKPAPKSKTKKSAGSDREAMEIVAKEKFDEAVKAGKKDLAIALFKQYRRSEKAKKLVDLSDTQLTNWMKDMDKELGN